MTGVVVRTVNRTDRPTVDAFARYGVATVHEAQERTGLMAARMRPIFAGAHISGTAVTVSVPPGDNCMIHVAVEQCTDGDILVVSPTSPSDAGYLGLTAMRERLAAKGLKYVDGEADA